MDPFVFEQSADRGSFLDEYTVLKELSLALGRISMCVFVAVLTYVAPLIVAFGVALLCAAASAGLSAFEVRRERLAWQ